MSPRQSPCDPGCWGPGMLQHNHRPLAGGIELWCPPVPPQPQVWSHYEEAPVEEVVPVLEEKERTANYKPVFVTEITDDLHFYVQDVETGTGTGLEARWDEAASFWWPEVGAGSVPLPRRPVGEADGEHAH